MHGAHRLKRRHTGQDDLGSSSKTEQPVGHDRTNGDLIVAGDDLGIDVETGAETRGADEGAIPDDVVIEDRETGDHVFTQLLDEVAPTESTVTPQSAYETDLFVTDPRLRQLVQHDRDQRRRPGRPRHVIEDDAYLFPAPCRNTDGRRPDGMKDRLPDAVRIHCRPVVTGHVTEFQLPAVGKGDIEGACVPPTKLRQTDRFHPAFTPLATRLATTSLIARVMSSALGKYQSSMSAAAGMGIMGAATRFAGARNIDGSADATHARTSAPTPQTLRDSSATTSLPVFATDPRMVSVSNGLRVLGSITSTSIPSSASAAALFSAWGTMPPTATTVTSLPDRATLALPNGTE